MVCLYNFCAVHCVLKTAIDPTCSHFLITCSSARLTTSLSHLPFYFVLMCLALKVFTAALLARRHGGGSDGSVYQELFTTIGSIQMLLDRNKACSVTIGSVELIDEWAHNLSFREVTPHAIPLSSCSEIHIRYEHTPDLSICCVDSSQVFEDSRTTEPDNG